ALNIGSVRVRIRSLVAAHAQQLALIAAQKKRNALAIPQIIETEQEKDKGQQIESSPTISPSPTITSQSSQSNLSKSSGSPQIQQQSTSASTSSTVKLVPFGYPSPASYEAQIQQLQQKQQKESKSSKGKEKKCDSCGGSYDGQPVGPDLIDSSITQGMSKIPKKPYTVLIHNFSFEHGPGYCAGMNAAGYNFLVCPDYEQQEMVNIGLRYVNNDCCYGTILIVGALLMSIEKKFVDPNLMHYCWIHMGGSCSSRCIGHYVRRAFIQAGYPQIGVTELNYNYLVNPELTIGQTMRVNFAFVIGDALTRCYHRCRAYEKVPGSTKELWQLWEKRYHEHVEHGSVTATPKFLKTMVKAFEELPLVTEERTKPRVGIIGTMCKVEPEFYDWLKDYLVDEEGCEVAILDFYGYAIAPSYNAMNQYKTYSFPISMKIGGYASQKMIQTFIGWGIDAFKNSKRFDPMRHMDTVLERTWSIVPATHISGEGWFYTSQFVFLLDLGIENFICTTPFDCKMSGEEESEVEHMLKYNLISLGLLGEEHGAGACCCTLYPRFGDENQEFISIDRDWKFIQRGKSLFNRNSELVVDEGEILNCKWNGRYLAWANSTGVRIYDFKKKSPAAKQLYFLLNRHK
ncbi:MAG: putative 2-hydroxyglutaryl-CoA dehydratase, partial [Streblomastix strix]